MVKKLNKQDLKQYAGLPGISFILLFFCSMTSYLFPIHNWVDQNCFLTLGKGILEGTVPYRDLFEQKGPLLYFIHSAGLLISDNNFHGVFIIQILFFTAYMIIMKKTAEIFLEDSRKALIVAVICGTVTAVTHCYRRGDNAEEFCLPFVAVALYWLLKAMKNGYSKTMTNKVMLLNGFLAGCIFWIKFTLLGFHLAWTAGFFVVMLTEKKYAKAFAGCVVFLCGMALSGVPYLIYFAMHDSLKDLFEVYIYSNIFLYSKHMTVAERIIYMLKTAGSNIIKNPTLDILIFTGLYGFCLTNRYIKKAGYKILLVLCSFVLFTGIFIGGTNYSYYYLITAFQSVLGGIYIVDILTERFPKMLDNITNGKKIATAVIFLAVTVTMSNSKFYYGMGKNDFPQYQFAEIINAEENTTLFNYNFLDGGFYLGAGKKPLSRYFCRVNIPQRNLPEMYEEQKNVLREKKADFVVSRVTRDMKSSIGALHMNASNSLLFQNYKIVCIGEEKHDKYNYILWEKD